MSPRALLALLSLFVSSSAVAVARPEATPVGTTSGPTPSGDAVRRADEDAVVLLSSMTVTAVEEADPGPAAGEFSVDKGLRAPFFMPLNCNPALSEIIFS